MTKLKNHSLEECALRYVPSTFRIWPSWVVAITALGGIAYLADFAIGASIGLTYGAINAIFAILFAAVIIFVTGFPLAYYASKYNIDLDLITRGSGFGYYGSVLTSVIFASFTFIFFALEGSIMSQGLELGLGIPLWLGYIVSTVIVIPLVVYGMRALSKLQVWTTPLWIILMSLPVIYVLCKNPDAVSHWLVYRGSEKYTVFNPAAIILGSGIALSLMGQIGEQIDYLRFMPMKTEATKKSWWLSVIMAGPGWVILGALKQMMGAFLAFSILAVTNTAIATQPVQQFMHTYHLFLPHSVAIALSVILVVLSQIKINVTNAYSGSLAWTNAFTRITKHYPGRIWFVLFNVSIALILMETNMFSFLSNILSFYSNCAIAWVMVVATDIVINKYLLKLSPKIPEYRRGMLYAINPVGFVSFILSAGFSISIYFGLFGKTLSAYSPLAAILIALFATPLLAIVTRGKFYLRKKEDGIKEVRFNKKGVASTDCFICSVCHHEYERPDVIYSVKQKKIVCSLCETTEK